MSKIEKTGLRRRSYNPLREAAIDSPDMAKSWLKNGQLMTPIQRAGHGAMSVIFIGIGMFVLDASLEAFRAGDVFWAICFGGVVAFFSFFGIVGLRNVLRCRAKEG